jgi:hypothetical protein
VLRICDSGISKVVALGAISKRKGDEAGTMLVKADTMCLIVFHYSIVLLLSSRSLEVRTRVVVALSVACRRSRPVRLLLS